MGAIKDAILKRAWLLWTRNLKQTGKNLLLPRRDCALRKAIVSLMIEALSNWELRLLGTGSRLAISVKISDSLLLRQRAASRDFSLRLSEFLLAEDRFVVVVKKDSKLISPVMITLFHKSTKRSIGNRSYRQIFSTNKVDTLYNDDLNSTNDNEKKSLVVESRPRSRTQTKNSRRREKK